MLDDSRQVLIVQLQSEAALLGRTPSVNDIRDACKNGRTAGAKLFYREFGSWPDALKAAGFVVRDLGNLSREAIILLLKNEGILLGRTPRLEDIDRASKEGRFPTSGRLYQIFGSFGRALHAAGFKANKVVKFDRATLLRQLKNEAMLLNKTTLLIDDIKESSRVRRTASHPVFVRMFGSWGAALQAAGLESTFETDLSRKNLIAQLRAESQRLGKTPTYPDINRASKEGRTASGTTFQTVFGSWKKALEAADLELNRVGGVYRYSRRDLVQQLKAEARSRNRKLRMKDIKQSRDKKTASLNTFINEFGSWRRALRAAGLD